MTDFRGAEGSCKTQFSGCLGGYFVEFASVRRYRCREADSILWSFLSFCR